MKAVGLLILACGSICSCLWSSAIYGIKKEWKEVIAANGGKCLAVDAGWTQDLGGPVQEMEDE